MSRTEDKVKELQKQLERDMRGIELDVITNYTLADAIREGSSVTEKANGWGGGDKACAMHAAVISARAREQM